MIHVDCQNSGNVVTLSDKTAKGKCSRCGTQLSLSTHGKTIAIDHYLPGGRLKNSNRGHGRGKSRETKREPKILKEMKGFAVNFIAVVIFVSIAVFLLAKFGG